MEARAAARLDHPHIVPVHDAGVERDVTWISSRIVEGQSLRESLAQGRLRPEVALLICLQAASALSHAHARGIVHRDVKPENILVERQKNGVEHAWITDFGIAKLLSEVAETTGQRAGTPAYMAPEQASGERVDERADIFALGCVAAELFSGQRLFQGETASEILRAIRDETPSLAGTEEHAGPEMTSVIRRCLARSPADRWRTMDELISAMHAMAGASAEDRAAHRPKWWPFRRSRPSFWIQPVVAERVRKQFGRSQRALDGVDLALSRGTVYALLGRPKAGKTTLIRTLLGIYHREGGRVALFGQDPQNGAPEAMARIGFVPDTLALDRNRRVREVVAFTARFYPKWDHDGCRRLLDRFSLPAGARLRMLTRDQQRKLSLVLALAHHPDLLVLDSPNAALEAASLGELVDALEEAVREDGATVLLAADPGEEIERVATHVGLLRNGRIEMSESLESLHRRVHAVHMTFSQIPPDLRQLRGFSITRAAPTRCHPLR